MYNKQIKDSAPVFVGHEDLHAVVRVPRRHHHRLCKWVCVDQLISKDQLKTMRGHDWVSDGSVGMNDALPPIHTHPHAQPHPPTRKARGLEEVQLVLE